MIILLKSLLQMFDLYYYFSYYLCEAMTTDMKATIKANWYHIEYIV
jgi:hypothetical protein